MSAQAVDEEVTDAVAVPANAPEAVEPMSEGGAASSSGVTSCPSPFHMIPLTVPVVKEVATPDDVEEEDEEEDDDDDDPEEYHRFDFTNKEGNPTNYLDKNVGCLTRMDDDLTLEIPQLEAELKGLHPAKEINTCRAKMDDDDDVDIHKTVRLSPHTHVPTC